MKNSMVQSNDKLNSKPILFEKKEDCCGCAACVAICPKEAINMIEDEEGFDYPVVKENLCIQCFMCVRVCPIKEAKVIEKVNTMDL